MISKVGFPARPDESEIHLLARLEDDWDDADEDIDEDLDEDIDEFEEEEEEEDTDFEEDERGYDWPAHRRMSRFQATDDDDWN